MDLRKAQKAVTDFTDLVNGHSNKQAIPTILDPIQYFTCQKLLFKLDHRESSIQWDGKILKIIEAVKANKFATSKMNANWREISKCKFYKTLIPPHMRSFVERSIWVKV